MDKIHCELLGYDISVAECVEMKNKEFFECQDCKQYEEGGEAMGMPKKSREGVTCEVCGKKAEDDQYFRFNKKRCCVCLSREIREAKAAAEEKEPEREKRKYTRKAAAKPHPHPDPLPEGERKSRAGLKPAPGDGKLIILDFSGSPELYETVTLIARDEMRTPENQVLYFLKKGDFSGLSKVPA